MTKPTASSGSCRRLARARLIRALVPAPTLSRRPISRSLRNQRRPRAAAPRHARPRGSLPACPRPSPARRRPRPVLRIHMINFDFELRLRHRPDAETLRRARRRALERDDGSDAALALLRVTAVHRETVQLHDGARDARGARRCRACCAAARRRRPRSRSATGCSPRATPPATLWVQRARRADLAHRPPRRRRQPPSGRQQRRLRAARHGPRRRLQPAPARALPVARATPAASRRSSS